MASPVMDDHKDDEKSLHSTMRAAQGKDYGDIDVMISVEDGVAKPSWDDIPPKKRSKHILIKTTAVCLAPGDCRVLSGKTRELQGPPSFPYIPCGDCSGIVVEIPESDTKDDEECYFAVGDRVAARFVEGPRGALAEYALIRADVCDRVPADMDLVSAAALASASCAVLLADRIRTNDRILVFGAGGGVGSHFCQLARSVHGASYIVGVGNTENQERLTSAPISCDMSIDYTQKDPFTDFEEFKQKPFDVIVDMASGAWLRVLEHPDIVKSASDEGRFMTLCPDSAIFEAHGVWDALTIFMFPAIWRGLQTRTWGRGTLPAYSYVLALDSKREVMTRTLKLAHEGKFEAVMDDVYPFTTDGVRRAFKRQHSRHPRGKVVIQVSDK